MFANNAAVVDSFLHHPHHSFLLLSSLHLLGSKVGSAFKGGRAVLFVIIAHHSFFTNSFIHPSIIRILLVRATGTYPTRGIAMKKNVVVSTCHGSRLVWAVPFSSSSSSILNLFIHSNAFATKAHSAHRSSSLTTPRQDRLCLQGAGNRSKVLGVIMVALEPSLYCLYGSGSGLPRTDWKAGTSS